MASSPNVLIIGAGAAGLATAQALTAAGRRVTILEARDRIGGRIYTHPDSSPHVPIELGAEFIHGKPPEIFRLVKQAGLRVNELGGEFWYSRNGRLHKDDFPSERSKVFQRLEQYRGPDISFRQFLERYCAELPSEDKLWAIAYVEGFHAADADRISVHSIIEGEKAEEEIDGDRQFRLADGYMGLLQVMRRNIEAQLCTWKFNHVVTSVRWRRGEVEIAARTPQGDNFSTFHAESVIITLPLSILQLPPDAPGAVRFLPALEMKQPALSRLAMGPAVHVTLVFREAFWRDDAITGTPGGLSRMLFLFSGNEWFPTWWSKLPVSAPVLTAWNAGPKAQRYSGASDTFVQEKAVRALSEILGVKGEEIGARLQRMHLHDWQADPYCQGGYSYVQVGGAKGAQRQLAEPVEGTLFFAGEATNFQGHHATVHGAMASGYRAAAEVQ